MDFLTYYLAGAVILMCTVIMLGIFWLRCTDKSGEGDNELGPGASFFASLTLIISSVLILGIIQGIKPDTTETLMSAVIGYTLGIFYDVFSD
jgi:hypothetical protein